MGITPATSTRGCALPDICGRFGSARLRWTSRFFIVALRYVALNPVRARLVEQPERWCWSSTRELIAGEDDHVVKVGPALERVGDFSAFLGEPFDEVLTYPALSKAENIGRLVGSEEWLTDMETRTGLVLMP